MIDCPTCQGKRFIGQTDADNPKGPLKPMRCPDCNGTGKATAAPDAPKDLVNDLAARGMEPGATPEIKIDRITKDWEVAQYLNLLQVYFSLGTKERSIERTLDKCFAAGSLKTTRERAERWLRAGVLIKGQPSLCNPAPEVYSLVQQGLIEIDGVANQAQLVEARANRVAMQLLEQIETQLEAAGGGSRETPELSIAGKLRSLHEVKDILAKLQPMLARKAAVNPANMSEAAAMELLIQILSAHPRIQEQLRATIVGEPMPVAPAKE